MLKLCRLGNTLHNLAIAYDIGQRESVSHYISSHFAIAGWQDHKR